MKRIRRIEIENSRAYFNRLSIQLDLGENLLLYGENGSGKTSLYKSLNEFIQSFYTNVKYTPNRYKASTAAGEIKLRIGDFDSATRVFSNEIDYSFGKEIDNTSVQNTGYLKALAQTKGFLNYRDLLRLYLFEEDDPNLFSFFIEHLLKNHIPLAQGGKITLLEEWKRARNDILAVHNRSELKHKRGKEELLAFEARLRSVLDSLFSEVNRFLASYFPDFFLAIGYDLKPMSFSYGRKRGKNNWSIKQDLRLTVNSGHASIKFYTEGLNEARLSAIAICIYLAALRANAGSDLRLLFLDDIFIGIDSSNRFPILKLLNKEFNGFQIVLATYDRSWYYLAKNFLMKENPQEWKFASLFSLPRTENGFIFAEPVLVDGDSMIDKARQYLHGGRDIDLPAASNYLRKALEELLNYPNLPKELFLSEDFTPIPGFKLTNHVDNVAKLFGEVGIDTTSIRVIDAYLHPLIHPLSHFEEEAPVYRNELIEVERAYDELRQQVNNFAHLCQLLCGTHSKLLIKYQTADMSYMARYEILLMDNVWVYKDGAGQGFFTKCACRAVHLEGFLNGGALPPFSPGPSDPRFNYSSLDDALQKLYDYENNVNGHHVIAHHDYDIVEIYVDRTNTVSFPLRRNALLATM